MLPQMLMLGLALIALLLYARDHGKPQTGVTNFWVGAIAIAIQMGLLYWGGFFDVLFK